MIKHEKNIDMTPRNMSVDGGLYVDGGYLPFCWDNENLYYNTEKPTEEDLEELKIFELNSPTPNNIWGKSYQHGTEKKKVPSDINISEWRKYWLCSQRIFYNKP